MTNHKDLFLIRGLPGAGKTTFAEVVAEEGDVLVTPDDFILNEQGEYAWSPERLQEAIQLCHAKVNKAMEEGVSRIFVHSVLNKFEHTAYYRERAKQHGYRVFSLITENHHGGKSVYPVPEETMERFREEFDITL